MKPAETPEEFAREVWEERHVALIRHNDRWKAQMALMVPSGYVLHKVMGKALLALIHEESGKCYGIRLSTKTPPSHRMLALLSAIRFAIRGPIQGPIRSESPLATHKDSV